MNKNIDWTGYTIKAVGDEVSVIGPKGAEYMLFRNMHSKLLSVITFKRTNRLKGYRMFTDANGSLVGLR